MTAEHEPCRWPPGPRAVNEIFNDKHESVAKFFGLLTSKPELKITRFSFFLKVAVDRILIGTYLCKEYAQSQAIKTNNMRYIIARNLYRVAQAFFYKPHLFAEILSQKSRVQLIHKTIAFRGSKPACKGHKLTESL